MSAWEIRCGAGMVSIVGQASPDAALSGGLALSQPSPDLILLCTEMGRNTGTSCLPPSQSVASLLSPLQNIGINYSQLLRNAGPSCSTHWPLIYHLSESPCVWVSGHGDSGQNCGYNLISVNKHYCCVSLANKVEDNGGDDQYKCVTTDIREKCDTNDQTH